MNIYLLRHGQTDWNLVWKMQGRTDIPLNEKGIAQAKDAAERLSDIPFDVIYSSPLQRAFDTALEIGKKHNVQVEILNDLTEMSFGVHEGHSPEDDPNPESRDILFNSPKEYVPVGDGESYEDLHKRCLKVLEVLKEDAKSCNNVLLVSHGALCKGLIRAMINADLSEFWNMPLLDNCQPLHVVYDGKDFILPEEYKKFYG